MRGKIECNANNQYSVSASVSASATQHTKNRTYYYTEIIVV